VAVKPRIRATAPKLDPAHCVGLDALLKRAGPCLRSRTDNEKPSLAAPGKGPEEGCFSYKRLA